MINEHLNEIGQRLDSYLNNYDNVLIIGDFDSKINESSMQFYSLYNLNSLSNQLAC